ncbi:hypothetical protein LCGC14_0403510 [marine sediment metagenome]|uniref:Uncharacterized protein n=1 Tax=marine sediment metagenome TaxID=412755 RepID=A0A0F9W546_9ZZZZ
MIRPIKNTRRINADKKIPEADPAWVEAFMILLLAKAGGKVSISLDRLKAFTGIQGEPATQLDYDEETRVVTLKLHEKLQIKEKKSDILTFEKRIIT